MEQSARRWEWRDELRRGLELFALTGFAVAQPLFDVVGDSPDFLLFRKATTGQIVALTLLVVLLPPLVL